MDSNYLQTLKAGGRERERETQARAYESLVISKGAENDTWRRFSCASAFARQSRIFDSSFLSHAQMFKLTKHSFLNSIRI